MRTTDILFFTMVNFLLLFDSNNQLHVKYAISTVKTIGKTVKSPLFKKLGNVMKNSVNIFRRNKKTIKNLACGLQEKYLRTTHNFGSKSVKYLGEEAIKKFKYTAPYVARAEGQQNIQKRSAAQMRKKELMNMAKRSAEWMKGKEIRSLISMVSKSKPYLPFLVGGGLMRMTQFNLVPAGVRKANPEIPDGIVKNEPIVIKDGISSSSNYKGKGKIDVQQNVDREFRGTPIKSMKRTDFTPLKGTFVDMKTLTKGKLTNGRGDTYEGPYGLSLEVKIGKFNLPDGDKYEGEYVQYIAQGEGKLTNLNDGRVYEGPFVNGNKEGMGTQTLKNGHVVNRLFECEYQYRHALKVYPAPRFKMPFARDVVSGNVPQGKGKITYKCGDKYEGDFVNGLKQGKGKYVFKDENVYTGEYMNDKVNGYGEYVWKNGNYYKGNWKDEKYDGEGVQFSKSKKQSKKCIWKDGKPVE